MHSILTTNPSTKMRNKFGRNRVTDENKKHNRRKKKIVVKSYVASVVFSLAASKSESQFFLG